MWVLLSAWLVQFTLINACYVCDPTVARIGGLLDFPSNLASFPADNWVANPGSLAFQAALRLNTLYGAPGDIYALGRVRRQTVTNFDTFTAFTSQVLLFCFLSILLLSRCRSRFGYFPRRTLLLSSDTTCWFRA